MPKPVSWRTVESFSAYNQASVLTASHGHRNIELLKWGGSMRFWGVKLVLALVSALPTSLFFAPQAGAQSPRVANWTLVERQTINSEAIYSWYRLVNTQSTTFGTPEEVCQYVVDWHHRRETPAVNHAGERLDQPKVINERFYNNGTYEPNFPAVGCVDKVQPRSSAAYLRTWLVRPKCLDGSAVIVQPRAGATEVDLYCGSTKLEIGSFKYEPGNYDRPGLSGVSSPPRKTVGDPVEVDTGAVTSEAADFSTADGLLRVDRHYRSSAASWQGHIALNQNAGFGSFWRGLLPGQLTACGNVNNTRFYYNFPEGGQLAFVVQNGSSWTFTGDQKSRVGMAMEVIPSQTSDVYFGVNGLTSAPNTVTDKEVRLSLANGEQIWFRRAGVYDSVSGCRFLVPVEHKLASGYAQAYQYATVADRHPQTVVDSFNRQLGLTWADAGAASNSIDGDAAAPGQGVTPGRVAQKNLTQITLPDGTRLQYTYGAHDATGFLGRLTSVQRLSSTNAVLWARTYLHEDTRFPLAMTGALDQNGVRIATFGYDAGGRGMLAERAGGYDRHELAYDDVANRRTITGPLGLSTSYQYAPAAGNFSRTPRALSTVTIADAPNVASATTEYSYDSATLVSGFRDGRSNLTANVNDAAKLRPTSITDANGTVVQLQWHPTLDVVTSVARPGRTVTYEYTAAGQLLREHAQDTNNDPPNSSFGQVRSQQYQWDTTGRLLSIARPDLVTPTTWRDIVSYTYDATGNRLTATNAVGQVTTYTSYDANGRPGLVTDPNGIATQYTYDPLGRINEIRVKHPSNATLDAITTLDYDTEGRINGIARPKTDKLIVDYDLAGRVTAVRAASGERIDYTHDAMGNVGTMTVKRANGTQARAIQRSFDALGRIMSETLGVGRTTTWAYDKNDNVIKTTTPRGNAIDASFDALDRLMNVVAPASGTASIGYNSLSDVASVTDAIAVQTQYVRNGFGEVVVENSPDRGQSVFAFDAWGRMTSSRDGRNQQIDYSYDQLDRLTTKTPVGQPASEVITYSYDAGGLGSYQKGRLTKVVDGTGTTLFQYDHRGNMLTKRQAIGTTTAANLRFAYDLGDRITQITYPSGRIVGYVRDTKGRVTTVRTKASSSVTSWTNIATAMQYEPFADLKQATLGNSLSMTVNWGNDGRLASRRLYVTSGGVNRSLLTYGYDNDDNIIGITDGVDAAKSMAYEYDASGRLARSTAQTGSYKREDYVYDFNGNRTQVERRTNAADATPVETDTYGLETGSNRLASITLAAGTRTIGYDGRGNTASETRPGSVSVTATYDGHGRLIGYDRTGDAVQANYYNGLDDRVTVVSSSVTSRYLYDNDGRLLGEYGASAAAANVKAEWIWLEPEVDTVNLPFGGGDGVGGYSPIATALTGGTLNWVHASHLGVPLAFTSNTGAVAPIPSATLLGFPGQLRTLPDLYYNRYRDYDVSTGRYIQADPIGLSGGSNSFLYANANPIRYTDPKGLFADTFADLGFIGYDIYRIIADNVLGGDGKGNGLGTNLTALGLDIVGAGVPFATGLGSASRGAKGLGSLTPGEASRIQSFADKHETTVNVVGSRAKGTAGPGSDFDYILGNDGATSRLRSKARKELPRGSSGGEVHPSKGETGIDVFKDVLDPNLPHIPFNPKGGK